MSTEPGTRVPVCRLFQRRAQVHSSCCVVSKGVFITFIHGGGGYLTCQRMPMEVREQCTEAGSLSIMWVPGVKVRPSGLVAKAGQSDEPSHQPSAHSLITAI